MPHPSSAGRPQLHADVPRFVRVVDLLLRRQRGISSDENNTPGNYTFILKGTKEVPRRLLQEKRKTIGLRVPSNPIALALLDTLGEPMLSTSLMLRQRFYRSRTRREIKDRLEKQVDLIIHGGYLGQQPTTVIDLTNDSPVVLREGVGDVTPFL